jgi:hypothetical protein
MRYARAVQRSFRAFFRAYPARFFRRGHAPRKTRVPVRSRGYVHGLFRDKLKPHKGAPRSVAYFFGGPLFRRQRDTL